MKLLIMQSSPASHHFLLLGSKYTPQHPVLTFGNVTQSKYVITAVKNQEV